MAKKRNSGESSAGHAFGGDWTKDKLDVLAGYLTAYTTALKDQPFVKGYIDAFAGTGYRDPRREGAVTSLSSDLLFPDLAENAPQEYLDGSARLALKTTPRFDRYIFIERSQRRCAQLEALKAEFTELAPDIRIHNGDANAEIQKMCALRWGNRRAVMFLDPYGMQVDWSTIEAIAKTEAIDLWLLFPLGIGVSRLLTKSGQIPPAWGHRLDVLLGTKDWFDEFYRFEAPKTLFDSDEQRVVRASNNVIGRYFNERLKLIFAGVAERPKVLLNSRKCPLYLLCFAAGNKKGASIAVKIAEHLLSKEAD